MHAEFTLNGGTILFGQAGDTEASPFISSGPKVDELYERGVATSHCNAIAGRNMAELQFSRQWGNQCG
jgi:hypothetical protein